MFYSFLILYCMLLCCLKHWSASSIHSFIQAISTAPLQVHYYSEVLPTQHEYCAGISRQSASGNCERRLERESNPWPFGRKVLTQPMRHSCPNVEFTYLYRCILKHLLSQLLSSFLRQVSKSFEVMSSFIHSRIYIAPYQRSYSSYWEMFPNPARPKRNSLQVLIECAY